MARGLVKKISYVLDPGRSCVKYEACWSEALAKTTFPGVTSYNKCRQQYGEHRICINMRKSKIIQVKRQRRIDEKLAKDKIEEEEKRLEEERKHDADREQADKDRGAKAEQFEAFLKYSEELRNKQDHRD
jgi:hypothetical protein